MRGVEVLIGPRQVRDQRFLVPTHAAGTPSSTHEFCPHAGSPGIAQSLLEVGSGVVVVESDAERADAARERVTAGLRARSKHEANSELRVEELLAPLAVRVGMAVVGGEEEEPALVIEAVFEDFEMKPAILRAAEAAFPGVAVLPSNTSSLSIDALASRLGLSGRGTFSACTSSIRCPARLSSSLSSAARRRWQRSRRPDHGLKYFGKESIEVRDSPGFATSRLGVALGPEAIWMVEEDVASVEDIDRGMVLGYRFPVGPLRLTDLVGLDVRLAIAEHLEATLGPRFTPPRLLREKVAQGELGRKVGRGFYRW